MSRIGVLEAMVVVFVCSEKKIEGMCGRKRESIYLRLAHLCQQMTSTSSLLSASNVPTSLQIHTVDGSLVQGVSIGIVGLKFGRGLACYITC